VQTFNAEVGEIWRCPEEPLDCSARGRSLGLGSRLGARLPFTAGDCDQLEARVVAVGLNQAPREVLRPPILPDGGGRGF
jgi:hypothetical protein